ncbi:MAG: serine/threonine protein kinase, partial [Planctomycetota bacterium]
AFSTSLSHAENWPGWRGPRGDGTSLEGNPPLHWDAASGENIVWKAAIPGDGHSSPVIWNDRVFLVTCLPESEERVLLCLDSATGEMIWRETVLTCPLETLHHLNSRASGTPVTDGKTVYVAFLEVDGSTVPAPNVGSPREITPGRIVVAAYDFDGNRRWLVRIGDFVSAHGFCSCPVIFEDLLIINGDHDGDSYIAALDRETGEIVWKHPRANGIRSYVTPIIREIDGRTQMVLSGSEHVTSLDPRTGSTLWTIDGPTEQFVASMVFDGERFFMACGFPDYHVMAIDPTGAGDVTTTHVAWHSTEARCYVPSPVLAAGCLLVANDDGIAHCYDAATGEHLWRERMGRHYSASLISAAGLAYLTDDDGVTKIIRPGPEPEVLAENNVGEFCCASPAIAGGRLFIRTERHLFCIAEANSGE